MAADGPVLAGEDDWSGCDSDSGLSEASAPSPPPPPARRRLGVPALRLGGAAAAGVPALNLGALGRPGADAPAPRTARVDPRPPQAAPAPGSLEVGVADPANDDGALQETWTVDVLAHALALSVPSVSRRAGTGGTARDPAARPSATRAGLEWAGTGRADDSEDDADSEDDEARGNGMFRALSSPQDENATPDLLGAPRGFARGGVGVGGIERSGRVALKLPLGLGALAPGAGAEAARADGEPIEADGSATARGEGGGGGASRVLTARASCDDGRQSLPALGARSESGKLAASPIKSARFAGLSLDLSSLRGPPEERRGAAGDRRAGAPAAGESAPEAANRADSCPVPPEVAAETARRLGVDPSRLTWHVLDAEAKAKGRAERRRATAPAPLSSQPSRRAVVSIAGSTLSLSSLELLARDRLWLLAENGRLERRLEETRAELERARAAGPRGAGWPGARTGAVGGHGADVAVAPLSARRGADGAARAAATDASVPRFPSPTKRGEASARGAQSDSCRLQRGSVVPRLSLGGAFAGAGAGGSSGPAGSAPPPGPAARGGKRGASGVGDLPALRDEPFGASRSPLKGAPRSARGARPPGQTGPSPPAGPPLSARSAPHIAFAVPPPGSARGGGGGGNGGRNRNNGGGGGGGGGSAGARSGSPDASGSSPSARAEVEALRRRLAESEAKRRSGRLALAEVRAEFARLLKELAKEGERRAEQGEDAKEDLIRAHQPGRDAVGW